MWWAARPGRTVMRVVNEAPVFEAPSLEADVVQMLEVGTEFEVLERREADGHSWARVAVGWVARAMDIEVRGRQGSGWGGCCLCIPAGG